MHEYSLSARGSAQVRPLYQARDNNIPISSSSSTTNRASIDKIAKFLDPSVD